MKPEKMESCLGSTLDGTELEKETHGKHAKKSFFFSVVHCCEEKEKKEKAVKKRVGSHRTGGVCLMQPS